MYETSLECENTMVRVGGFRKTQNRIRRQRARGRFISPYQVGGTIFGKSVMARYPLMYSSSRLLEPWRMTQRQRRKMKGGTIFGTSTRMRMGDPMKVLRADQEKARMNRWKAGNLFSKLKKRIQIDFPHRPFPVAHPISDGYRLRKSIKRRRR